MLDGLTAEQNLRYKEVNVRILEMSIKIVSSEPTPFPLTIEQRLDKIQFVFNKLVRSELNPICGLY